MSTFGAAIRKARPGQQDLVHAKEHCSADPERLRAIGRSAGQQVRIARSATERAIYTVSETRQERPDTVVRMGTAGRRRLGTSAGFDALVDADVPHHGSLSDAEAKRRAEFVERLTDAGGQRRLIAIAPHGGQIEPLTDLQAERLRAALGSERASAWRCKGFDGGGRAHDRWHITSTDIHPASFPRLHRVIGRKFTFAVAFHGFGGTGVLIGGAAPQALKAEIERAIERVLSGADGPVRIAASGDDLGGTNPRNIVNRLTADGTGGIHIEQSRRVRDRHWRAVTDAVADVFAAKLR